MNNRYCRSQPTAIRPIVTAMSVVPVGKVLVAVIGDSRHPECQFMQYVIYVII